MISHRSISIRSINAWRSISRLTHFKQAEASFFLFQIFPIL
ncbi:Uncharacterized protein dnl_62540 [Desulfonema limicola]|uniref:Uncharacterized protein n=1 Tax=Desulfonema limicola TaxID=45656 RepID=A0A975BE83_9BACT|nr:Uncharacterized protein dnl_62540 [Desulfonema limicola]